MSSDLVDLTTLLIIYNLTNFVTIDPLPAKFLNLICHPFKVKWVKKNYNIF